MKTINNIVYPDSGKILQFKDLYYSNLNLGTILYNGELINVSLDDILELCVIEIDNNKYYLENISTYDRLVSDLVHLKYSLDDEIALISNYTNGSHKDEFNEYQEWRNKCKSKAKEIINE